VIPGWKLTRSDILVLQRSRDAIPLQLTNRSTWEGKETALLLTSLVVRVKYSNFFRSGSFRPSSGQSYSLTFSSWLTGPGCSLTVNYPTTSWLSIKWVWGWILQGCSSNTNFCTALCDGKWWHNYNCSTPLCLTTKLMHNTVVKKKWNIFRWLNVSKWSWRHGGIILLRAQSKYEAKY